MAYFAILYVLQKVCFSEDLKAKGENLCRYCYEYPIFCDAHGKKPFCSRTCANLFWENIGEGKEFYTM
jgi:hypothetical protein